MSLNVGDLVKIKRDGMQLHANSIPAHLGYSLSTWEWRRLLSEIQESNVVGEITRVYGKGDQYNVRFDGYLYQIPNYMLEKVG